MMLDLVLMDDSQYSWRNAFVAVDEEATEGNVEYAPVAGAIVGYNGADLHRLRRRFQEEALKQLRDGLLADGRRDRSGRVLSRLAGYLSRISSPRHSTPTAETCHRARRKPQPAAALLVDKGNPNAERLYRSVGFEYCNDAMWGGHEMRLRCPIA